MSPLKVVALSSQPCKHSTDHPEALATICAWGMENFTSKNLYAQVTSSEGYMLELVPWSLLQGKSSGQSLKVGGSYPSCLPVSSDLYLIPGFGHKPCLG